MADELDVVVAGAGVVGLAVARALALAGRDVVVLEAEDAFGTGASSRNSEVVHAGLYYPTGSWKARLCVAGRRALYAYCTARGIAHRVCGKFVVATATEQEGKLRALFAQAQANGVEGMHWLGAAEAMAMEPALHCTAALHSTTTGIVDSHALMRALLTDAEEHGATLLLQSPVRAVRPVGGGLELDVGGAEPTTLRVRTFVNSAGLGAPALAAATAGLPAACRPAGHRCKGNYFALTTKAPFSRLVYPLHDAAGLGVHLTLDLAGQARFGPDTEWVADEGELDQDVHEARGLGFAAAIRRYWPGLPDGALAPAYAGVRAKLSGPGEPAVDFRIDGPGEHGVAGLVNLLGIESPGLTASLAIGEVVAGMVAG